MLHSIWCRLHVLRVVMILYYHTTVTRFTSFEVCLSDLRRPLLAGLDLPDGVALEVHILVDTPLLV